MDIQLFGLCLFLSVITMALLASFWMRINQPLFTPTLATVSLHLLVQVGVAAIGYYFVEPMDALLTGKVMQMEIYAFLINLGFGFGIKITHSYRQRGLPKIGEVVDGRIVERMEFLATVSPLGILLALGLGGITGMVIYIPSVVFGVVWAAIFRHLDTPMLQKQVDELWADFMKNIG